MDLVSRHAPSAPAAAAPADANTPAAAPALSFPLALTEITDDGLRRIEAACRAERIRRALAAAARAGRPVARPADDPEDTLLEGLPRDVLAGIARRMSADIPGGTLA